MNIRPQTAEVLKKFFKELYQETMRLVTIGFVAATPYLISVLIQYRDSMVWGFDYRMFLTWAALGILGVKGADRALHESGISEKGIVRF